jgi:hypothetical protein
VITADCDSIRDYLDAFVDGELRGAELRHVAAHIDACRRCTEEVETRQTLGGLIRESVADGYHHSIPTGLSAGVVARVRAESYFSWRGVLSRAVEDWHWAIVGGGAVGGTLLSVLLCSAILLLGTERPRAGSLSSLGTSLMSSPGSLYAEVSREGEGEQVLLVQVDNGAPSTTPYPLTSPGCEDERGLVEALVQVVSHNGRLVELASMPAAERRQVELLLDKIARARMAAPTTVGAMGPLTVKRLYYAENIDVRPLD